MKMENFSTSELSQLLLLVSELRKEDPDIAINDYHQATAQHRAFCKALRIEDTDFARDRAERLSSAGRASIYKTLPAEIRFLSASDTIIPDIPIIDLTDSYARAKNIDITEVYSTGAGKDLPDGAGPNPSTLQPSHEVTE